MDAGFLCPLAEVQVKPKSAHASLTRRQFLAAASMAGVGLAAGCSRGGSSWEALSAHEAQTLAALCDQIIPADDYPSASQAGVVTYIDHQLTRPYKRQLAAYAAGLQQADRLCSGQFGVNLAEASSEQQSATAHALEQRNRRFFELARAHTFEGYYGSPRHGGNRDAVSWRMLGLTEPPVRGRAVYDLTAKARS
jgi:gluconate 2-dehydrogenase gamma chain